MKKRILSQERAIQGRHHFLSMGVVMAGPSQGAFWPLDQSSWDPEWVHGVHYAGSRSQGWLKVVMSHKQMVHKWNRSMNFHAKPRERNVLAGLQLNDYNVLFTLGSMNVSCLTIQWILQDTIHCKMFNLTQSSHSTRLISMSKYLIIEWIETSSNCAH